MNEEIKIEMKILKSWNLRLKILMSNVNNK